MNAHQVTLGEGNTPLIRSQRIGPAVGLKNLYFKLETVNPTGSYKDRFAAAAISSMVSNGQTRCLATSSGNTGAALAAYCAAANINCEIAIVESAPTDKLQQMMAYGADIFRVRGFGSDAKITERTFDVLKKQTLNSDAALQISAFKYSPIGMNGVKSISYELAKECDRQIDHVFCPAGGGGLTLAVAQGFEELLQAGTIPRSPRIQCVQPEGNNTIAGPLQDGLSLAQAVTCTSQISGLQVASVVDGNAVIESCIATGGTGYLVADEEVWNVQKRFAFEEGIFSEPAGAVALAGAIQSVKKGVVNPEETIVCLVTGSGFKDINSVERMIKGIDCPTIEIAELELVD